MAPKPSHIVVTGSNSRCLRSQVARYHRPPPGIARSSASRRSGLARYRRVGVPAGDERPRRPTASALHLLERGGERPVKGARVGIVGTTFDEGVPDLRNMDVDGWQTPNQEFADKPTDLPAGPRIILLQRPRNQIPTRLRQPAPSRTTAAVTDQQRWKLTPVNVSPPRPNLFTITNPLLPNKTLQVDTSAPAGAEIALKDTPLGSTPSGWVVQPST
jgi:hypothetical protein